MECKWEMRWTKNATLACKNYMMLTVKYCKVISSALLEIGYGNINVSISHIIIPKCEFSVVSCD